MKLSAEHKRKIGEANRRIGKGKRDPLKFNLAIKLYRQGETCKSIGDQLGLGAMTVWRWLKESDVRTVSQGERIKGRAWSEARRKHHPKKAERSINEPRGYDIIVQRTLGNKSKSSHGYVVVHTGRKKREYEHRLIAERVIGRPLKKTEVVHHIDGVRDNNKTTNLMVCTHKYHRWLHAELDRVYGENWPSHFS